MPQNETVVDPCCPSSINKRQPAVSSSISVIAVLRWNSNLLSAELRFKKVWFKLYAKDDSFGHSTAAC